MPLLWVSLLLGALPATVPTVPLDEPSLRARVLAGDLVSLERARAVLLDRGRWPSTGPLALLLDLSRLERCLPLGPVPEAERGRVGAARRLARLERIRLERRLVDGEPTGTALDLLVAGSRFADQRADDHRLVRWPVSSVRGVEERWPGELPDPEIEPSRCTERAARAKELARAKNAPSAALSEAEAGRGARRAAEAKALLELLPLVPELPEEAAARVVYGALTGLDPTSAELFRDPAALESALARGAPPIASAGLLALAAEAERRGELERARERYRRVLSLDSRTEEEDSRARTRLVRLLEPDAAEVMDLVRGAKRLRAVDRPVLENAEARALYAHRDWEGLAAFGRVWLRTSAPRASASPIHDVATADLLEKLALQLPAAAAMAWVEELGPASGRVARLERLARLSADSGRIDLAIAITDRLRVEAAGERGRRGPSAALDLARFTADRALLEYQQDDPAGFAGMVDALVAMAKDDEAQPLARTAPHKELARLAQELLGRLTETVDAQPERRRFAGVLLEAMARIAGQPSRWRDALLRYQAPLQLLAGPYALGRVPPLPAGARAPKKAIRSLGEVVLPRLPPRLDAPDVPTPLPLVDSYLVHLGSDGGWVVGAPWVPAPSQPER
jgi:hypothetical protein